MVGGTYAVIPVKPFASAKRRLQPFLDRFERMRLARLMLCDVLDAVHAAHHVAAVVVVSCDAEVAALAEARGAQVIREPGELGLDRAVATAAGALAAEAGGIAVVPADIPHLSPALLDQVIGMTGDNGVTLLPAVYDGGTNLLCMRPPHLMTPRFGPGSFQRHYRAAREAGAATRIHVCQRTGYDIDRPRDLETFLGFGSDTRTHDYLDGLGIRQRCAETSCAAPAIGFAQVQL